MENLKTKVTAHKGIIVIETKDPVADSDFIPAGGSKIGCVLANTKDRLGISGEALELLKKIPRSGDDIGDVDSFTSDKSGDVFTWLGPACRLVDPASASGSRTYDIGNIEFNTIPNEVPKRAAAAIDKKVV